MISMIRKSGNSFVVTVSREEMAQAGVEVGDQVLVELRAVDIRPKLTPALEAISQAVIAHPETAEAFGILANG